MGDVADKFRRVCNQIDGVPNYPVDWLPELYAIADEMSRSVKADEDGGLHCTRSNVKRFLFKFAAFQKKYRSCK